MKFSASFQRGLPLICQCALILIGLLGLYAAPPTQGRMLLLPLTMEARGDLAQVAIAHGARLIAHGPWAGSMLVEGRRDELVPALMREGVIALSAQMGGCGEQA
jgi:hypothetical protein